MTISCPHISCLEFEEKKENDIGYNSNIAVKSRLLFSHIKYSTVCVDWYLYYWGAKYGKPSSPRGKVLIFSIICV